MQNRLLIEKLFNSVNLLGKIMAQITQESHEQATATFLQFTALDLVKNHKHATVGTLKKDLQLSKSSATQLAERLEKSGFVKKVNDKKDRRIIKLQITQTGEKEHERIKQKTMENMNKLFSKLPEKDIRQLIRITTFLANEHKKDIKQSNT